MAKGKKSPKTVKQTKIKPQSVGNVFDDKKYAEEQYSKNYEFQEKRPVRSPGSDWDFERMHNDEQFMTGYEKNIGLSQRERSLVLGTTHGFGHRGNKLSGALRLSGNHAAHQIGKRK